MKKGVPLCFGLMWIFLAGVCVAQTTPHEIGGFALGKDIKEYGDAILSTSDIPIRYLDSIHEVEIKPIPGFKSGIISYGTCLHKGSILRIRLKYEDDSKDFYEVLLKRFKKRFGEPDEWRGDPFHIVINWKWSFVDKLNNRISLQLQHNTKDVEEKIGNTVKLSMPNAIEAEIRCFEEKTGLSKRQQQKQPAGPPNWDLLIPR